MNARQNHLCTGHGRKVCWSGRRSASAAWANTGCAGQRRRILRCAATANPVVWSVNLPFCRERVGLAELEGQICALLVVSSNVCITTDSIRLELWNSDQLVKPHRVCKQSSSPLLHHKLHWSRAPLQPAGKTHATLAKTARHYQTVSMCYCRLLAQHSKFTSCISGPASRQQLLHVLTS